MDEPKKIFMTSDPAFVESMKTREARRAAAFAESVERIKANLEALIAADVRKRTEKRK